MVFIGDPELAQPFAESAIRKELTVSFIASPSFVCPTNLASVVHVLENLDADSFLGCLDEEISRTLFVSVASRWIFRPEILNLTGGQLVNIHPSMLPRDRGGACLSWQVMRGSRVSAATIHVVDQGIDTGPVLLAAQRPIPREMRTVHDIELFNMELRLGLFEDLLECLKAGQAITTTAQLSGLSNYLPRLQQDTHSWIDWRLGALDLERFVTAFDVPFKGALSIYKGREVRIKKVQAHENSSMNYPQFPGMVYFKEKDWLIVTTASGQSLIIEEVVDAKTERNLLPDIKLGERFHTPSDKLESAIATRVTFGVSAGFVRN